MSTAPRPRAGAADDEGSVLLLTIGYAVLALVLVLVCVDATSLYLQQKRADAVADAAALAGADGFELRVDGGVPVARLTDADVRAQAEQMVAADGAAVVIAADTPDGVSARVTVETVWHPPVLTLFVPEGLTLQATATSRTALR
ncbi:pilus assembly protein TadG-related protein [Microbacterium sp. W1N]|uniref:pilus assembly protein TadG-related protein n=1 Tax=Microbacterium festucae TaxID=2977531 RepID=UPI0021BE50F6|nr:pilus assembly protein TadG-related protein [Microbacterium festucae]MCT9820395.1 pilus assembly protein TadG-related protein [Microbacterium festucae]